MRFYQLLFLALITLSSCGESTNKDKSATDDAQAFDVVQVMPAGFHKSTPTWADDAVLYSLVLSNYTSEGNLTAFQEHLPRLEGMGVDIISIDLFGGLVDRSSSQETRKFETNSFSDFGQRYADDLKILVDDAHERDLRVIIDWPSADHERLKDETTDNREKKFPSQDFTILTMMDWVHKTDIDGFWISNSNKLAIDDWLTVRYNLEQIKPIVLVTDTDVQSTAFDVYYDSEWSDALFGLQVATKKISDVIGSGKSKKNGLAFSYKTHHTLLGTSVNGSTFDHAGLQAEPAAVLSSTWSGIPMIIGGQESQRDLRYTQSTDADWESVPLSGLYTRLAAIRHNNGALWSGCSPVVVSSSDNEDVISYHLEKNREMVLVLLNFSDQEQTIAINTENIEGYYEENFTGDELDLEGDYKETLRPWGYRVYEIRALTDLETKVLY